MITDEKRKSWVVQWCLCLTGVGWGLSFLFAFWSWETSVVGLKMMGGRELGYDPFLHYWMRIIGVIFGSFGVFCLVVAVRLEKYATVISWIGWVHLICFGVAGTSAATSCMEFSRYPTLLAELAFFLTIGLTLILGVIGNSRGIPSDSCASPK